MPESVRKDPLIAEGDFTVERVVELAFFDLTGTKAGTQGTSNKSYHAELQKSKKNGDCQIYTIWGPTGAPNQTREWRHYADIAKAQKDFDSIIKSKKKKGYEEIDVAQRAYGSEAAKVITKPVALKNTDQIDGADKARPSSLHVSTQKLIAHLFGETSKFVVTTLKCPLGQLSNAQIDAGRAHLDAAKAILNAVIPGKKIPAADLKALEDLTNKFYSTIPHNLGQGARGQMLHLVFDDLNKVVAKEGDLDTLLDAKSVGAVLNDDVGVDAQYKELNADLEWIDPASPLFSFMSTYFEKSKVSQHGFHSSKVKNLWIVRRKDQESTFFLNNSEKIASQCGKNTFAKEAKDLCRDAETWVANNRPDLSKEEKELFNKSNTWICWHGTRSANVVGITKRGLMVRPAGAVHTGSMFGDGKYYAYSSTKSLNYTDGGYWTGGRTKNTSRFMFGLDVSLGNMYVAPRPMFYKCPPKNFHSVYGKANVSGVMNDEMITYDFTLESTQSRIKYLFEITD